MTRDTDVQQAGTAALPGVATELPHAATAPGTITDFPANTKHLRPSPLATAGVSRETPAATNPTRPAGDAGCKEEI